MTFECAGMHERRERMLLDASTSEIVITLRAANIFEQARGTDDVAESQAGKKGFREAADVEHSLIRIERSQRGNLRSVVSKLSIVVVLEDPARMLRRVAKQFFAARLRHDRSRRKLMRGTDADQRRSDGRQLAAHQALFIDGGGEDSGAVNSDRI